MSVLGSRIKELRTSNNLTQEEFGKLFGVVKSTVSLYEKGVNSPDNEMLLKIADYFNVTTDYLLGKSSHPQLSRRNELDIAKEIADIEESVKNGSLRLSMDGEEIDEEIAEYLIQSYKDTILLAKLKAKEKFTPKKYKKNTDK